jgi:hypothetical protein
MPFIYISIAPVNGALATQAISGRVAVAFLRSAYIYRGSEWRSLNSRNLREGGSGVPEFCIYLSWLWKEISEQKQSPDRQQWRSCVLHISIVLIDRDLWTEEISGQVAVAFLRSAYIYRGSERRSLNRRNLRAGSSGVPAFCIHQSWIWEEISEQKQSPDRQQWRSCVLHISIVALNGDLWTEEISGQVAVAFLRSTYIYRASG